MTIHPDSVAIFGPGLMGASLLMALRARFPGVRLGAWARRREPLEELARRGLVDFQSTNAGEVAAMASLAVLCLPVERLHDVARLVAPALARGAVATDVGSVKRSVVEDLEECFAGGRFVGSHPMCGSEASGLAAARPDLYEGAVCVVTPTPRSSPDAVARVSSLWQMAGARTVEMDPARHDRAAATASHVPHVAAALLVELVADGAPDAPLLCAGGFRDTTRVAAGPADLWTGILAANRDEVARALGLAADRLHELQSRLEAGDLPAIREFFAGAARHRAEILSGN